MQLCAVGGVVDWRSVEESIDPEVMDWWLAFDQINPIGDKRADQRIATMTSWLFAGLTGEARPVEDFRCIPNHCGESSSTEFDFDEWAESRRQRVAAEQSQFMG